MFKTFAYRAPQDVDAEQLIFDELVPGSSNSDIPNRSSHNGTFNDQHNL